MGPQQRVVQRGQRLCPLYSGHLPACPDLLRHRCCPQQDLQPRRSPYGWPRQLGSPRHRHCRPGRPHEPCPHCCPRRHLERDGRHLDVHHCPHRRCHHRLRRLPVPLPGGQRGCQDCRAWRRRRLPDCCL